MRTIAVLAALVVATLALACGESTVGPTGPGGTLKVMIKDTPYSDAKSLLVTFSEVTAHRSSDAGFSKLPFADAAATTRTCDLKKLVNAEDVLGVGTIPEGHYTQLRLVVTDAVLFWDNAATGPACATAVARPLGNSATVVIQSGEVKLNREFDVKATGATTILLDFNGEQSVIQTGNSTYRMTPVIGIVSVQ